jgi:hypothetical protein
MNVVPVLEILRGSFSGFHGSADTLFHELIARKDFRSLADCPSQDRFLSDLKLIAPQAKQYGVEITVSASGLVDVRSTAAAQQERDEVERLRAAYNSPIPEAAATRKEFGTFERFLFYKRGVAAGRITPPRQGRNAIHEEDRGASTEVDPRLTIEARCRNRWEIEPNTRSSFNDNYGAFEAYERAKARGVVRKFAPGA